MTLKAKYALIAIATFFAEILVATVFAQIAFVRSHLSDFLVVILIYYFVKIFWKLPPVPLAMVVFLFACGVEATQYFHLVDSLGMRHDSLLGIISGTSFSWLDILAYLLGSLASCIIDITITRKVTKEQNYNPYHL